MRENLNLLNLFNYKKLISSALFFFVLLLNPTLAKQSFIKSEILKKSNECFNDFKYKKVCENLFLEMERIQVVESEQKRYKCQASILGLQTELIKAYYFENLRKNHNSIMISYVIKNC